MDSDKLTYQKNPGEVPLRKPIIVVPPKRVRKVGGVAPLSYSKDHGKGKGVLSPAVVYVLSGGSEREKTYFRNLRNDKILSSCVQVLFQSKQGQGLQPYQMDKIWQTGQRQGYINYEGKRYRQNKIDKVFLVSDVDEFEPQLVSILSQKRKSDYGQWIISNPCIEIWLYYCFRNDIAAEIEKLRYVSRAKRSQQMKRLNDMLIKGGADPRKAFDNTPSGIVNSKAHYRTGHYGIPGLFATSCHIMMAQIQSFSIERGHSFAEYQEAKRKKIEAFLAGKE